MSQKVKNFPIYHVNNMEELLRMGPCLSLLASFNRADLFARLEQLSVPFLYHARVYEFFRYI